MENSFDNMCRVYGIDPEIGGQIPCPPVENRKIQIKMEMYDTCDWMCRELELIKDRFKALPVDDYKGTLAYMEASMQRMKQAQSLIQTIRFPSADELKSYFEEV